ncbi:MAG: FHA domain-containing protein [Spirulinaceae cyanobacterium SM2_1_0]|nr:FHA domain-containing protein [Spirulinaceae cyanobacterium SM2_1_0]
MSESTSSAIVLTLLHPLQAVPVQSWTFNPEAPIRIGRSTDNEVILYSAVVSRHHVEIRPRGETDWEVVNLGANGTYIDGKRITKMPVIDGMVIRLASSGPQIQIRIEEGQFGDVRSRRNLPPLGEDKSKDTLIT